MSLIADFIGVMPEKCGECKFLERRTTEGAWPYVCELDEQEIYNIEGSLPKDCPLLLIEEEL